MNGKKVKLNLVKEVFIKLFKSLFGRVLILCVRNKIEVKGKIEIEENFKVYCLYEWKINDWRNFYVKKKIGVKERVMYILEVWN